MSEWIVYSKDGLTERCRLKKLEYAGSYMNERTVTATFEYHSEVAFEVFDYIVYRGERFELEAIPSVKKTSKFGYTYELRFVSLKYELERCEMRDIVPNDNGVTYPSPLSFSFTGSVRYLAERIQANLDSLYGKGVWTISVASEVSNEEKNITISQQNCWNALSLVNTSYGLDFSIKGRNVTIGKKQPVVSHVFQYGKGNGLYEIERVADTGTGIVTKLRAYGSTRNLDYSYPKKPEWTDSVLPVSFILSPLRLMLPSFKLDGKTDYIMANDSVVEEYGIRESSMIYEDIYPTITDVVNSNGDSIDEIMAVEEVDDSSSTFVVYLYDLGFDLESHLTTEDAQISMKSGAMQGYTFNISKIEKQEDNTYKITLGRITTDSSNTGNYDIPNSQWGMSAGDKFVLLNILMPQEYIRAAEQRLLVRAQEYLAEYGKTNFSYNIGLNDKFLKEHENIYDELIEGSKLSVYDEELGIREEVTIQSITIDDYMEDNILPQVKVTLNNKPSASTLERIQGKINELSDSASNSFSTQTELLQQYRKKLDKPFFDRLFAAVDKDGKEIPSTDLSTPISYIKARFSLASLGGITMYLDDKSFNLPTIYDGLPIDSQTIYWENIKDGNGVVIGKILKAKIGGGTLGSLTNVGEWADSIADVDRIMVQKKGSDTWEAMDVSEIGSASFENISESGEGNAYTSFELSEDKKFLTLVKGETFALASDLENKWTTDEELINNWNTAFGWGNHAEAGYALQTSLDLVSEKLNNFLEGSDTDSIINKWKELEVFLGGLTESDNLAEILATKANQSALEETNRILATKWTKDDTKIANWDAAFSWGDHSKAGYAAKSYVDSTFVTIAGNEDVTGVHNFVNGLKIGGKLIDKPQDDVIYIDANLVVRGGITMYGDRDANIPSILNSIPTAGYDDIKARGLIAFNSKHFVINNGVVSAIQGSAGLDVEQLGNYLKNNHYATEDWVKEYIVEINTGETVNITQQMVIDALGFTPYDASNPNGYITSATLDGYLPLKANAASATKLSDNTSFTIWGQEFFVNGKPKNVSGDISLNQNAILNHKEWKMLFDTNDCLLLGHDYALNGLPSYIRGYKLYLQTGRDLKDSVYIDNTGNVGIGTTSPSAKLHVYGGATPIMCESNTSESSIYFIGAGTNSEYRWAIGKGVWGIGGKFGIGEYNTAKNLFVQIGTNGYVGIGVPYNNSPSEKLHVIGNILSTGTITTNDSLTINGIKLHKSQDGVLYLDGNLVVKGGVTMYGTDATSAPSILDSLPVASTSAKGIAQFSGDYFTVSDGIVRIIDGSVGLKESELNAILDGKNYATKTDLSGYLPLTGGTISNVDYGALIVLRKSNQGFSGIRFSNWSGVLGYLGIGGSASDFPNQPTFIDTSFNAYGLIHSGNIGSQSVNYATTAGNADTLDGVHASNLMRLYVSNDNVDDLAGNRIILFNGIIPPHAVGITQHWGAILQWSSESIKKPSEGGYYFQLWGDTQKEHLWYRVRVNGNAWKATKQIAFVTDNVASATYATTAGNAEKFAGVDFATLVSIIPTNTNQLENGAGFITSSGYSAGVTDYYDGTSNISIGYQSSSLTASQIDYIAAYSIASGNIVIKDVDKSTMQSWLGLGSFAYKSSLAFSELTSKPTTISGYGITDAITTSNIGSQSVNYATSSGSCTGNAASATKLQTARTIWGQSFDGTGNVTGDLLLGFNRIKGNNDVWNDGTYDHTWYGLDMANGQNGVNSLTISNYFGMTFKTHLGNISLTQIGNVGIGTTTPSAKLHVYGGATPIMCESNTSESSIYFIGAGTNSEYRWAIGKGVWGIGGKFGIGEYNTAKTLFVQIDTNGYVGIGVPYNNSPSERLHVNGSVKSEGGIIGTNYALDNASNNPYLKLSLNSINWYVQAYDSYMYLGKGISKSMRIDLEGNILSTGGITMYSARILKNIVDERGLSLKELSVIKPTRYTWKDGRDNRIHFGGIADDIQQVLPEVVYKTAEGVLTMDYGNAGFAIAASLIKPVVDHEQRIKALEKENELLKQELNRLRA